MSQTLPGFSGNERLQHLAAQVGTRSMNPVSGTNNPIARRSNSSGYELPRALLPSPASPPNPALPSAPLLTTPPRPLMDLRGYSGPGAPADFATFSYLWHIQKIHGKTAILVDSPPEAQKIISSIDTHALVTWIKQLGGYDELERNPRKWNQIVCRLGLVKSEGQDDERSRYVVEVVQRVGQVWLRPFEQYCTDWPLVSKLEKEQLLYRLGRKIRALDPTITRLPFACDIWSDKDFWPPVPLEPLDPRFAPYVAIRLAELSEPGIPEDYAICFYLVKLWDLSTDPNRPQEVPHLPQPKPGADGKFEQLSHYTVFVAINKLQGSVDALRQTAGAWNQLAFKLKLIDREDQNDAYSKQVVVQLQKYIKDYFCYFKMFCDRWVGLDKNAKDGAILQLLKSLYPEAFEPKSKVASPLASSEPGSSVPLKTAALPPQQGNRPPIDLYAYNTPGIPQDALTTNYFVRLWLLDAGRLPPLPTWNGVRIKVDLRHMRSLIDGFGGSAAMRRLPELWREMAYELKLATREERGTEHLKCLVESLQFIEQVHLLPFERFCANWAGLGQEEKAKRIGRLAVFLQQAKPEFSLPLPWLGGGAPTIQVDALSTARTLEQKMERFYPDDPFEERVKRLRTLTIEEAAKYGMESWIAHFQRTPFSDENVKTMAAVLAGAPSTSKPLQLATVQKVESLQTKPLGSAPAQQVGLWSPEVIQAANRFVRETLKKIDDSRAMCQPRVEVPEPERARLKRIIGQTYPFAFRFYSHAALHYMMYAKGLWTEFLMRQACLVLEQFFFLHVGSSLYIADIKDAQFARSVLRNEVQKTQLNYTLKAVGFQTSHGNFTK